MFAKLWGSLRSAHVGSPAPETGTGLGARMGASLSTSARMGSEKLRLQVIKRSQEHCPARPAKTGARPSATPLAQHQSPACPAECCRTLIPTTEMPSSPTARSPAAFWVSEIPSQPRCRWSQLDAQLLWQRVPRDEIPISFSFFFFFG